MGTRISRMLRVAGTGLAVRSDVVSAHPPVSAKNKKHCRATGPPVLPCPESTFRPGTKRPNNLSWIVLVAVLSLQDFILAEAAPFETQPRDRHDQLIESALAGLPATSQVRQWKEGTGDSSFDSFLEVSGSEVEALKLEKRALAHWDNGNPESALPLFLRAGEILVKDRSNSEAAFCFYYASEILANQEKYATSLALQERSIGLASAGAGNSHYLLGTLYQSQGYTLWFLDNLPASVQSFGQAQEHFEKLGWNDGIVTSWNSLAILFEELHLPEKAHQGYLQAVHRVDRTLDPRIRFQLHANFATFLKGQGHSRPAIHQLKQAELLGGGSTFQRLLLRCSVLADKSSRQKLLGLIPLTASEKIERLLTLAETEKDKDKTLDFFRAAMKLSSDPSQRYWRRKTVDRYGEWLEVSGRFLEASKLYRQACLPLENESQPEVLFPYSRSVARHFDGWVRCLIRLNRWQVAQKAIRRAGAQRMHRAGNLLRVPSQVNHPEPGANTLRAAADLERQVSANCSRENSDTSTRALPHHGRASVRFPSLSARYPDLPARTIQASGFSILEMWPDGDRVYVWITNPDSELHKELLLSRPVRELLNELLAPLQDARDWLPPSPDPALRYQLYEQLFRPLEAAIETRSVLIVMHKELEDLPLEMLQDASGEQLMQRFCFSYLPSVPYREISTQTKRGDPVAVFPDSSEPGTAFQERDSLQTAFPKLEVLSDLQQPLSGEFRWVHLSSHFWLEKDFWIGSRFTAANQLPLTGLLNQPFRCSLLSLGVCDAAYSYRWGSPYWMGISELLLARSAEALVVSRWKLDELASKLYVFFFQNCLKGMPMDQALNQARLRFLRQDHYRNGIRAPSDNPFFWAGVSYLGRPGVSLYEAPGGDADKVVLGVLCVLVIFSIALWRK